MEQLDLNQMVGLVRNEAAKARAYLYMDEILTKVLDAEKLVEDATKRLADIERQVQNKSESLAAMEVEYSNREVELSKHLEDITEEAKAKADSIVKEANDKAAKVYEKLADEREMHNTVLADIATLNDERKILEREERDALDRLRIARAELAKLRSKLDS